MAYAALVLLAIVVGVVQELRVRTARTAATDAERVRKAWEEAAAATAQEARRLETIIAGHRAELTALEDALARCDDPAVVRARLRELLGGPPAAAQG